MFISFLGIGQGGSNIADEAAKRGFYSAAINFSGKDLDSLEFINKKLKLIGSEGVGKSRNHAINLMEHNWDIAINFVKENFSHPSIEIIFVPFSTGGGSGSGISPVLLNMLIEEMQDKVFVAMPIIPDKTESYISQQNSLETFEDLTQIEICILPIDNEKGYQLTSIKGKSQLYTFINSSVINLIQHLLNYTEKSSKYGIVDKKDLRSLFDTAGYSIISKVQLEPLKINMEHNDYGISDKIHVSWENSPFANINTSIITKSGIIYEGNEQLMEYLNYDMVFKIFNNKFPISLYEGYYQEENNTITTILTGLSPIKTRLEEISNLTEKISQSFIHNKSQIQTLNLSKQTNILIQKQEKQKVKDISSIINKFKR